MVTIVLLEILGSLKFFNLLNFQVLWPVLILIFWISDFQAHLRPVVFDLPKKTMFSERIEALEIDFGTPQITKISWRKRISSPLEKICRNLDSGPSKFKPLKRVSLEFQVEIFQIKTEKWKGKQKLSSAKILRKLRYYNLQFWIRSSDSKLQAEFCE